MTVFAILLLSAALQEEKPFPENLAQDPPVDGAPRVEVLAAARLGGWGSGGFEALTPGGGRKISPDFLVDGGLDLGVGYAGWSLMLTLDHAESADLQITTGGLLLGANWIVVDQEPFPLDFQLQVGVVGGQLDVEAGGFGDFKPSVGFEARLGATSWLWGTSGVGLWLDFRQLSFKYDEAVLSGDTRTGGSTIAFGASVIVRF